jgi:hypothetical protein
MAMMPPGQVTSVIRLLSVLMAFTVLSLVSTPASHGRGRSHVTQYGTRVTRTIPARLAARGYQQQGRDFTSLSYVIGRRIELGERLFELVEEIRVGMFR